MIALFLAGLAQAATLDEAWKAAEEQSHEALMAAAQREIVDLTPLRVAGGLMPRVSAGAGVTFNQVEVSFDPANMFPSSVNDLIEQLTGAPLPAGDPIVIQRKTAFDANLTILQPLVLAPAFAQAAGVKNVVAQGEAQEAAQLARLKTGVTQSYWAVVVTRAAQALSEKSVENAKAHEAIVQTQVDAGAVPRQALLQAQLAVSRSVREQQAATARRKVAERVLSALTGFSEDEALSEPASVVLPFPNVDAAMAEAIANRPDLKAASESVEIARTQRLATQLGWVPTISGRFTESYSQNTGFAGRNWLWNAGINASWSIWDGGQRVADTSAARSQLHLAEAALARAQDDTRIAVIQAWEEHARAQAALAAVEREVALAAENLRIAELSLQAGNSPFQDVEDARIAMLAAELGRVQEHMNEHVAAITLLIVTGARP